jgi:hypothetical protein
MLNNVSRPGKRYLARAYPHMPASSVPSAAAPTVYPALFSSQRTKMPSE